MGAVRQITRCLGLAKRCEDERRVKRRDYRYVEKIAPFVNGAVPQREAFFSVQCCDLSSKGFAFVAASKPNCDMMAAKIEGYDNDVYLVARVVHVRRVAGFRREYKVGCEFLGRSDPMGYEALASLSSR